MHRWSPLHLEIVHGIIIQVGLPAMIALGRARVLMPRRVLYLLELRTVLQGQRDKAGTQAVRSQALQPLDARRIGLDLRLDGLVAHRPARGMVAAAEAHKERVA